VLNVVHGSVPTVDRICDHPDIKAISLVGAIRPEGKSREVRPHFIGPSLISTLFFRGALNGKRVQADLGAKNHALIMPAGIAHIDYQ